MSERERNQAKALEYARSQGWLPPDEQLRVKVDNGQTVLLQTGQAEKRIADLESAVDLQNVTIQDLEDELKKLRGRGMRKRAAELESALADLLAALDSEREIVFADDTPIATAYEFAKSLLG